MSDEVCDAGTDLGCLSDCTGDAPGYICSGGDETQPDTCDEVCGDDLITPSEACEDGNSVGGDGCFNCQAEVGWTCSNTDLTSATNECTEICGDDILVGVETCDDGGLGGCYNTCAGESPGYDCYPSGLGSDCTTVCMDGIHVGDEQCDDGDTNNVNGCTNSCTIMEGYSCYDVGVIPRS